MTPAGWEIAEECSRKAEYLWLRLYRRMSKTGQPIPRARVKAACRDVEGTDRAVAELLDAGALSEDDDGIYIPELVGRPVSQSPSSWPPPELPADWAELELVTRGLPAGILGEVWEKWRNTRMAKGHHVVDARADWRNWCVGEQKYRMKAVAQNAYGSPHGREGQRTRPMAHHEQDELAAFKERRRKEREKTQNAA